MTLPTPSAPVAAEGAYLDLWVDGELSYRIKPSRAVKKVRERQNEGGVFSGDADEPLYGTTYLPRKFKCAVTVPGDNSVDLLTQDIGLVAVLPMPAVSCAVATCMWEAAWAAPTTRRKPSPARPTRSAMWTQSTCSIWCRRSSPCSAITATATTGAIRA